MASYLCPECDVRFPSTFVVGGVCPLHRAAMTYNPVTAADPNWSELFERAKAEYTRQENGRRAVPIAPDIEIVEEHGLLWLRQADLLALNIQRQQGLGFWPIEIRGVLYEAQGWHESGRRWWIEAIVNRIPNKAPRPRRKRAAKGGN